MILLVVTLSLLGLSFFFVIFNILMTIMFCLCVCKFHFDCDVGDCEEGLCESSNYGCCPFICFCCGCGLMFSGCWPCILTLVLVVIVARRVKKLRRYFVRVRYEKSFHESNILKANENNCLMFDSDNCKKLQKKLNHIEIHAGVSKFQFETMRKINDSTVYTCGYLFDISETGAQIMGFEIEKDGKVEVWEDFEGFILRSFNYRMVNDDNLIVAANGKDPLFWRGNQVTHDAVSSIGSLMEYYSETERNYYSSERVVHQMHKFGRFYNKYLIVNFPSRTMKKCSRKLYEEPFEILTCENGGNCYVEKLFPVDKSGEEWLYQIVELLEKEDNVEYFMEYHLFDIDKMGNANKAATLKRRVRDKSYVGTFGKPLISNLIDRNNLLILENGGSKWDFQYDLTRLELYSVKNNLFKLVTVVEFEKGIYVIKIIARKPHENMTSHINRYDSVKFPEKYYEFLEKGVIFVVLNSGFVFVELGKKQSFQRIFFDEKLVYRKKKKIKVIVHKITRNSWRLAIIANHIYLFDVEKDAKLSFDIRFKVRKIINDFTHPTNVSQKRTFWLRNRFIGEITNDGLKYFDISKGFSGFIDHKFKLNNLPRRKEKFLFGGKFTRIVSNVENILIPYNNIVLLKQIFEIGGSIKVFDRVVYRGRVFQIIPLGNKAVFGLFGKFIVWRLNYFDIFKLFMLFVWKEGCLAKDVLLYEIFPFIDPMDIYRSVWRKYLRVK